MATPDLYGQAVQALAQGRGADASPLLVRALKRPGLPRDEQIQIRCALAEAWLLQDDLRQATEALADGPIRVRIGLHAGAAHLAGDDYGGFEVSRAARVASAASGAS